MVRVTARRQQGFTHEVEIQGGHHLVIDEPEESGGANQGPSPTRTLAATPAPRSRWRCTRAARVGSWARWR
jgi:uncharacterized OsmC-like protein